MPSTVSQQAMAYSVKARLTLLLGKARQKLFSHFQRCRYRRINSILVPFRGEERHRIVCRDMELLGEKTRLYS